MAGNRYAYCDGTDWDRPLGYCRREYNFQFLNTSKFCFPKLCSTSNIRYRPM